MPPAGAAELGSSSSDPAVQRAHTAFRDIAGQRLKLLLAEGTESIDASSQLFDDLLGHRAPQQGSRKSAANPTLQLIAERTGATPERASQILQLKEEIGRLRGEGHSTASLIEQLRRRLSEAGERAAAHAAAAAAATAAGGAQGAGSAGHDENGKRCLYAEQKTYEGRPPNSGNNSAQGQKKKLRVAEHEMAGAALTPPRLQELPELRNGVPLDCALAVAEPKRVREDGMATAPPPLPQLKKLKLCPELPALP